jgi:hypothetical protein
LNDPTSASWAVAYVRLALRDKPNDASAYPLGSLQDEELLALLAGAAVIDTSVTPNVTYYPAHRVAASILTSNPEFVQRWSAAGVSEEYRDVKAVARDIISAGKWIETTILSESGGRISFDQVRLVT